MLFLGDGRSPQRGGFERIGRRRSNNRCLSRVKDLTLRVSFGICTFLVLLNRTSTAN